LLGQQVDDAVGQTQRDAGDAEHDERQDRTAVGEYQDQQDGAEGDREQDAVDLAEHLGQVDYRGGRPGHVKLQAGRVDRGPAQHGDVAAQLFRLGADQPDDDLGGLPVVGDDRAHRREGEPVVEQLADAERGQHDLDLVGLGDTRGPAVDQDRRGGLQPGEPVGGLAYRGGLRAGGQVRRAVVALDVAEVAAGTGDRQGDHQKEHGVQSRPYPPRPGARGDRRFRTGLRLGCHDAFLSPTTAGGRPREATHPSISMDYLHRDSPPLRAR
jgi:hypothetical protein